MTSRMKAILPRLSESVSGHRTVRHLPLLLFLLGILAYGGSFAWYVLANFDLVNLVRDMNIDDAYYYFQTARNLADGKFSTFDGGITRTNGYHPLWMLFITPFYWVLDPETALFGIKVLEIMLVAAGVALIVLAARLAHLSWILLFAALPALYQRQFLFMGMEAAAALFLLGLFFLVLILFARDPARWRWALAATGFILPWVRLEYVAISISATAMLCLMEWPQKGQRLDRAASVLVRHEAAVPLLASCAGILAYFAYNGLVFGGIVPVSGSVKLWWSRGDFAAEGGYDLVRNVQDIMQVLDGYARDPGVAGGAVRELLVALEAGCYFLLVWGFSRGQGKREDRLLLAFLAGASSLGVEHLAKIAQTALTMSPFNVSYSAWYYVPAYLAVALIVPVRCWVAIHFIRRFGPQNRAVQQISRFCILAIGATFVFNQTSFTYPYRFVDRSRHSLAMDWSWEMSSYAGAQVINRILPEGSVIGAWDSGVVGYFSRFPVVNLDGLMNSYDYLRSPAKRSFYHKFGITHFADNRLDDDRDYDGTLFESRPFVTGEEHAFEIWHEAPTWMASGAAGPAGHLWERMAPYFDHRTGGGAGVVVHGRMVQVFPRVCGSMRDEFMIFSWADHEGRSDLHILDPLKSTRKTKAGFCSYTFLLPQGAVRPIHVDTTLKSDFVSELIGSHQPVILSDYHVFHAGSNLVYVKQQCDEEEETESGPFFFLHIFPAYAGVLPEHRRRQNLDYDNLDFRFPSHGSEVEGTCVAVRALPRYPIAKVRTGQYVADGPWLWHGEFRLDVDAEWIAETIERAEPVIRSDFDVYYDGNRLLYTGGECSDENLTHPFFLHVFPEDEDDLPATHREYGFHVLAFRFEERRLPLDFHFRHRESPGDVKCMALVELPGYEVARIRTGQYVPDGPWLWHGEFRLDVDAERIAGTIERAEPVIRSDFDVYYDGNRLLYTGGECSDENLTHPFFLHIFPEDEDDLPAAHREYGFHILAFRFEERRLPLDFHFRHRESPGDVKCIALVELPGYEVARIRTGQYVPDGPWLWHGEFEIGRSAP